jgi:rod shape-determining protein MreD
MIAAFLQSSLVRLIPVGVIVLALQRTLVEDMKVGGVIVQLVLALVAAAGASGGSERGAVAGFVLGSMFDLAEGTPLGSSAIAFTIAGVVAGLLALFVADPRWWLKAIFVAFGAAAGEAMLPVVRLFVGQQNPWPTDMIRIILLVALSSAVMSPLLLPLSRWCLKIRGPEWKSPAEQGEL